MTGHLLGAAGAVEAIASIMALERGIIPPTINHFTDDPAFDPRLNLTFNKAQKLEIKPALSNTFGFGGHNTSVIFRKYDEQMISVMPISSIYNLYISNAKDNVRVLTNLLVYVPKNHSLYTLSF